jgi:predicted transcriptional regulator
MTERGILTESNGLYRTTEKGLEALRHLKALREIIPEF